MEKRYFIKVGNCFVEFLGIWHEAKMRSEYKKATPYLTQEDARREAIKRGVRNFKIVEKLL